jgi:Spy/CpxP family protein refolding chaperone
LVFSCRGGSDTTFSVTSAYKDWGQLGPETQYNGDGRMRIVRIATMAIALCAVSASIASAQRDSTQRGGRRGGMMGPNLLEGITLSDAQQVQIKMIREKYAPKRMELMQAMRSSGMPPDSATRAQMQAITDAQTADIRAVLTADQQKILDKNIAEDKERRANRRPPPPGN